MVGWAVATFRFLCCMFVIRPVVRARHAYDGYVPISEYGLFVFILIAYVLHRISLSLQYQKLFYYLPDFLFPLVYLLVSLQLFSINIHLHRSQLLICSLILCSTFHVFSVAIAYFLQSCSVQVPFSFSPLLNLAFLLTFYWLLLRILIWAFLLFRVCLSVFRLSRLFSSISLKRVLEMMFRASLRCQTIPGVYRSLTIMAFEILQSVLDASAGSIGEVGEVYNSVLSALR